jgi:hypothetical protein
MAVPGVVQRPAKWMGQSVIGENRREAKGLGWFIATIALFFADSFLFHFSGFKLAFITSVRLEQALSLLFFIMITVFLFALFRLNILSDRNAIARRNLQKIML